MAIATTPAPAFFGLVGHPVRWRLLSELSRSDRRVGELCSLVGERQNLVSYHLRQLRGGGLVSSRRSSHDGRDTYYALDLSRCRDLHASAGAALHPGLVAGAPRESAGPPVRVLFLCTGNSGRSQMAEGLAGPLSGGVIDAASAGSRPKPLHAEAVRVMADRGIDISAQWSKHLSEFADREFDLVITLCDRVREVCPEFPGAPERMHWSIPDPARAEDVPAAFEATAAELQTRIPFLATTIEEARSHA